MGGCDLAGVSNSGAITPEQIRVQGSAPQVSYFTAPFVQTGFAIEQQFRTLGSLVNDSAGQAYEGFVNAFVNSRPIGLGQMALGVAGLIPDAGGAEEIAERIATGHAFEKHFAELLKLGITNRDQLKALVQEVIETAAEGNVRQLQGGRAAFWDDSRGLVVIYNPSAIDKGTVFVPRDGRKHFDADLH